VNPGSVGMPYGAGPTWALLHGGDVSLHRTAIDPVAVADELRGVSSFPRVDEWVAEYILDPASDAEAVRVFGPRDGRDAPRRQ
jgi:hypothetical protein